MVIPPCSVHSLRAGAVEGVGSGAWGCSAHRLRSWRVDNPPWARSRKEVHRVAPSLRYRARGFTADTRRRREVLNERGPAGSGSTTGSDSFTPTETSKNPPDRAPADWEDNPNYNISTFSELPHSNFGVNQHILINDEFKEALRQILWQFRAPIRYAFAYGSGVFSQSSNSSLIKSLPSGPATIHSNPSAAVSRAQGTQPKMIDFIFGVSYTQHWHSLNLHQHRDHYSALGYLGSGAVTRVQDGWGAGVYFNPYITVNGTLIKYGIVNLDNLCDDLTTWSTLYLAGRLHKPVKILRDEPRVRLANQVNLISALRTALLLLPPTFTELELYATIASISYMGDPRMSFPTENPSKVKNIVGHNLPNFRRLYAPLIETLPNVSFNDASCQHDSWVDDASLNVRLEQDMDPVRRGNMVRRVPVAFREKLYFQFQKVYQIPGAQWAEMMHRRDDEAADRVQKRDGGEFERRIAGEGDVLRKEVRQAIKRTVSWPSWEQSIKGLFTAGASRSWRYASEKIAKWREGKTEAQKSEKP